MPVRTRTGAPSESAAEAEDPAPEAAGASDAEADGESGESGESGEEGEEGEKGEEDDGEADGEESDDDELEGEDLEDEEDEADSSDEEDEVVINEDGPDEEAGQEEPAAEEEEEEDEEAVRKSAMVLSLGGADDEAADGAAAFEPESDSEDEMPLNTIGNVPLEWYDDFDHVGYDLEGKKIMRAAKQDELDALIKRFDDPDASRTIHDALHGVDVVLSKDDVALIKRLQRRRYPGANFDPYPDVAIFDYPDGKIHPLSSAPPRKAPFLPSKDEAKKVMKLVMAMRSEQYQKSVANRREQDAKVYIYILLVFSFIY